MESDRQLHQRHAVGKSCVTFFTLCFGLPRAFVTLGRAFVFFLVFFFSQMRSELLAHQLITDAILKFWKFSFQFLSLLFRCSNHSVCFFFFQAFCEVYLFILSLVDDTFALCFCSFILSFKILHFYNLNFHYFSHTRF